MHRITRDRAPVKGAAEAIIEALGGDVRAGRCCCPAHNGSNPTTLSVTTAPTGRVLVHCFAGCEQTAVLDALRDRGLWPVPGTATSQRVKLRRPDDERRAFAREILANVRANRGVELAGFLPKYFLPRGIATVPPTALVAVPWLLDRAEGLTTDSLAMVFPVSDGNQEIGAHLTWLIGTNPRALAEQLAGISDPIIVQLICEAGQLAGESPKDLLAERLVKRPRQPVRQFFGPISGGFIKLYSGELEPADKLIIAEGVETAMAASQLAGDLPAIAGLSATNMPKVIPPRAAEYIICADHDTAGLAGARALAAKLARAGNLVRVAIPPTPGTDWNDFLINKEVYDDC